MKTFTPLQTALALSAMSSREAGFPGMAEAFVKALKNDMGVGEGLARSAGTARNGGNRRDYGRFRLTEADECALEVVETPRATP